MLEGFKASIEKAREKWTERRIPTTRFSRAIQDREAELQLLVKSGRIRHLCESFRDRMNSTDIEEGVSVLDEIMRLLGMTEGITLTSFEDLGRIVIDVSERLIKLKDYRSAELLSSTLLRFIGSASA